ncbi:MAG: type II toxin-antitoxin system prevent-host-death family antitoxin [Vicinamibacterales bacterium]
MTIVAEKRYAQYNIADAKSRLSSIVRETLAGVEVVIAKDNKPLVTLVPVKGHGRRTPGSAKGQVTMAPDFDAPLDDFAGYR